MDTCVVKTNKDDILSSIIVLFYYAMIINNVLKRLIVIDGNIFLILLLAIIFVYCLKFFPTIAKYSLKPIILSEGVALAIYLFSFLMGTPIVTLLHYASQTIIFILFGGIIYGIDDYSVLAKKIEKHSYYYLLILSLVYLNKNSFSYLMSHSYLMLVPTLIHIKTIFIDKRILHLVLVVYEIYTILIVGSRGPLIVIVIYTIALGFFTVKKIGIKIFLLIIIATVYCLIIINGKSTFLFLQSHGIYSRSLELILTDIGYDTGRGEIKQIGIDLVQQKPLLGWGVAGETQFFGGGYVHNQFLELIIDYGIIFGTVCYFAIIIFYLIALLRVKNYWFVLMMICLGFIPLFVSNSYLLSYDFILSIFVALSLTLKKTKREVQLV